MSRATDFAAYEAHYKGLPEATCLQDMTPTPLTTSDAAPETGTVTATGPWVRNPGRPGTVHVELSNTTTPTATVVVEYSNTQTGKGAVVRDTLVLDAAGEGQMSDLFTGSLWVRVRCTAISGSSASVTATLGVGL